MKKQTNLFWKYKKSTISFLLLFLVFIWLYFNNPLTLTRAVIPILLTLFALASPFIIIFLLFKNKDLIKKHKIGSIIGGVCGLLIGFYPSFFNAGMIGMAGHSSKGAETVMVLAFFIVLFFFSGIGVLIGLGIEVLRKK